jgi:Tfp pilus assembly protein PilZ
MNVDLRQYIRHPVAIPIAVEPTYGNTDSSLVKDISHGGLCFICEHHFSEGDKLHFTISICQPEFVAEGIVCWCQKINNDYLIGLAFSDEEVFFSVRMVEQICHIENYRQQLEEAGEKITIEQAAKEWIEKYASSFP